MYLSKQERQILLVLSALNPRELRIKEIMVNVTSRTRRRYEARTMNVLYSSFSRSMKSLREKGLVTRRLVASKYVKNVYWSLTPLGNVESFEIRRSIRSKLEELNEYNNLVVTLESQQRLGVHR
jgi:predicted DNA-binding transcriptional regulator